jgi:hypothetical protein
MYLDISDPAGAIFQRGSLTVDGEAQGWGADNGRWNLDFADGQTAHVIGCKGATYCDGSGYILATADFSDPDHPTVVSELTIPSTGWSVAARFDGDRLYLSPSDYSYSQDNTTPFQVYDLTDAAAPKLAGTVTIQGTLWNLIPAGSGRVFALGNDWGNNQNGDGEAVLLEYLDVSNPAAPAILGNVTFGQGWAWTPAAGTFKAFTMDASKGLVVLPFSGWSYTDYTYTNGLQLIEFTDNSANVSGTANTRGWVERGIFVGDRLVSLSDLALSVVDYSNHAAPVVTAELTLARNVVAARPNGDTIAEISTDWWWNDLSTSEVRVLPIDDAEESGDQAAARSVTVDGVDAQVFTNGNFAYIVTDVQTPCQTGSNGPCGRTQQVQVVDLSNGGAKLRGVVRLPEDQWGYGYYGWEGCFWWDWWGGSEVVQVGGDAIAFRRWEPVFDSNGNFVDENTLLYVVDLSDADAPALASTTITDDPNGWWGNMRVIGETLYTTHYEWVSQPGNMNGGTVQYFVDRIDLSNPAHPRIEAKINVPGFIVGGSDDGTLLYTVDYRWDGTNELNDFDVLRLHGDVAELLSTTSIDGYVGNTFIANDKAYVSAQLYDNTSNSSSIALHAIDLSNPSRPVDRVASGRGGWGWLLGVEGDRALVISGWGSNGVDVYQLADGQAPVYSQTIRTYGWWPNAVTRQDNSLFFSSGYWGVQRVDLQ